MSAISSCLEDRIGTESLYPYSRPNSVLLFSGLTIFVTLLYTSLSISCSTAPTDNDSDHQELRKTVE